ncbi:hypothetical protein E1A91_A05G211600v1 [Gossypium mustelinum]|uniref:Uncharacterized protein n=1 Tax=Gossypium mustelinum TaxID=34275 RepID=A0A5D2ZAS6_GOSMU|nr:hypothetical protein E1A91_A05G211600v1 [Gossypium mustelinum]
MEKGLFDVTTVGDFSFCLVNREETLPFRCKAKQRGQASGRGEGGAPEEERHTWELGFLPSLFLLKILKFLGYGLL